MKRTFLLLSASFCFFLSSAQLIIKDKKYPSLLWEITGKGLKKPSYLIGTMHVSSKMAFNLPDSFYIALRNAEVVALETNPETWQEDMSKYELGSDAYSSRYGGYTAMPNDYLKISTLRFDKYETEIQKALFSNPSTINNLLYRSYGNAASDFEEDTYLDMYIFQCGKKWGKKITGVENYGESMKLMAEAYKDGAKDNTKKERSYNDNQDYSTDKLQEAYRTGNLDLLDSINKYNSFSTAFDEKFLYKRNEIQAASIDSILKSGSPLFVGVGAAHLPGTRGVIELLRRNGYRLRPVKMGARASRQKDLVDKLRVPVTFRTTVAEDGFYRVDIPGTFYPGGDGMVQRQQQYADMANGSYYMVTRILTNAWVWGHSTETVYKKIDSLLYENIPGKILSKTSLIKNGYKGIDIVNRTRRGDVQRYNIFITPFEILFFKMSGNGDYVKTGEEAKKFFGGISLKEYTSPLASVVTEWKKFSPPTGGFSVNFPHIPFTSDDGNRVYDAEDKTTHTHFRVMRTDIHNYGFAEEDSFDLGLMDESFMASGFIDAQLMRKQTTWKGYPALDAKYRTKTGAVYLNRYIIQGPHYYTVMAYGKQETASMRNFLNSFEITPNLYGPVNLQKDSSLYFSVETPVYPGDKKIKLDMPSPYSYGGEETEQTEEDLLEAGAFRSKIISNDTTGEKIYVSFYRSPRYFYAKDSSLLENDKLFSGIGDTSWIIRSRKKSELPGNIKVNEVVLSDTGSSRSILGKSFYKDGIGFTLLTEGDTLSAPGSFIKTFYETFSPADSLKGVNPFEKKSALYFTDFMSGDSVLHQRAVRNIYAIELDSADLPALKKAIASLNWKEKKYLDTKEALINKFGQIKTKQAADYLKQLYYALEDTVQLQYPVLENLLNHKTAYAYSIFRDMINADPPVLTANTDRYDDYSIAEINRPGNSITEGTFLDALSDSLKLTRTILPDLLPLLNLQDYKRGIMSLLGQMVDSNLITTKDYEMYFSKFLVEAKQELKKQSIAEKRKAIQKAEASKEENKQPSYGPKEEDKDNGNDDLSLYACLLLPFSNTSPAVLPLLQQMLSSSDKKLKYNTLLLLLKNKRSYPDSLLTYFAELDEYRYQLYTDLKRLKLSGKFPSSFNNHIDLAKSSLLTKQLYQQPDSVVYIDRLKTQYLNKSGFVYFFKFKSKKDDISWMLATVGLVPEDPSAFEFEDSAITKNTGYSLYNYQYNHYDFTAFSSTKIDEDEPMAAQLQKQLKKMLYSKRKSGKMFYEEDERNGSLMRDYYE